MHKLAVLPLFFAPMIAWGDCTQHLQGWARALHPQLEFDSEHAVCKVNPADSSQILAVLPFAVSIEENEDANYGLDVLVADSATAKVITHRYQAVALDTSASRFWSVKLDTARYQVTPALRAFGVRFTYEGSSSPYPYESETLSLYVHDGSQLRQIMSSLVVRKNQGDWDTRCAGTFNEMNRTLAIGNPGKEGFASLRITEKSTDSQNVLKADDNCEEIVAEPKTMTFTLNYIDGQYGVPKGLSN